MNSDRKDLLFSVPVDKIMTAAGFTQIGMTVAANYDALVLLYQKEGDVMPVVITISGLEFIKNEENISEFAKVRAEQALASYERENAKRRG